MGVHEFSVPVHDLDAAGKHIRLPVRAAWVRGALEGTDAQVAGPDGELDVRISKSGTDVVVRGRVKAELTVACARCLEPAHVVVAEPISALVVPASALRAQKAGDEGESPADEADVISFDGETVVLDDLVRDELLLGIPMIPLCSDACAGIRPEISPPPASAEGVDPRLRPLLRLKKRLT